MSILLTAGGAALAFAFLPFLLIDVIDSSLVWRICSGVIATWQFGLMLYCVREALVLGVTKALGKRALSVLLVFQSTVLVLSVLNALWFASSSLYVVAVFWFVVTAFMSFIALLLNAWAEPLVLHRRREITGQIDRTLGMQSPWTQLTIMLLTSTSAVWISAVADYLSCQ